jgi:hypothetical protein
MACLFQGKSANRCADQAKNQSAKIDVLTNAATGCGDGPSADPNRCQAVGAINIALTVVGLLAAVAPELVDTGLLRLIPRFRGDVSSASIPHNSGVPAEIQTVVGQLKQGLSAPQGIGPGAMKAAPQPWMPMMDDLEAAATAPDRNGFTSGGRALQKHSNRANSSYPSIGGGDPADYNPVAAGIIRDVLGDAAAQIETRIHDTLGPIMDIYGGPFGFGLRYSTSGRFIGLLNP